jgi:hypothetical protein
MRQKHVHLAPAESHIRCLREQNVLLDADLAALYGVTTKALLQAVRRNLSRFPSDFMFQLTDQEVTNLRSQIVTSGLNRIEAIIIKTLKKLYHANHGYSKEDF